MIRDGVCLSRPASNGVACRDDGLQARKGLALTLVLTHATHEQQPETDRRIVDRAGRRTVLFSQSSNNDFSQPMIRRELVSAGRLLLVDAHRAAAAARARRAAPPIATASAARPAYARPRLGSCAGADVHCCPPLSK